MIHEEENKPLKPFKTRKPFLRARTRDDALVSTLAKLTLANAIEDGFETRFQDLQSRAPLPAFQKYHGFQTGFDTQHTEQHYPVEVEIQSYCPTLSSGSGELSIHDLTPNYPVLTTHFEIEYIGDESNRFGFETGHPEWKTTPEVDRMYWSRFPEWLRQYEEKSIKGKSSMMNLSFDDLQFMRWKETHHTFPRGRLQGAIYDGFYYVCLDKRRQIIDGYYYASSLTTTNRNCSRIFFDDDDLVIAESSSSQFMQRLHLECITNRFGTPLEFYSLT